MNKNEILELSKKELAVLRAKAQNVAYLNLAAARQNSDFVKIEKIEKNLTFEIGKLKAFNLNYLDKEKKLKEIIKQKEEILKTLNLKISDLTPSYSCKLCNDIGYIGDKMCYCLKAKINDKLIKECSKGKNELYSFKDFNDNITVDPDHKEQLIKLKKKFTQVAKEFPNNTPKFILLSGKTGVGKTFLCECLARELIDKGHLVSFISAFGMNNLFLSYHISGNDEKKNYINALIDPDVLVIDDLGTEPILKNVTKEYLYLILSERSFQNKLTVVSTNLQPKELMDRYNERIFSRLFNKRESFLNNILGADLRINANRK